MDLGVSATHWSGESTQAQAVTTLILVAVSFVQPAPAEALADCTRPCLLRLKSLGIRRTLSDFIRGNMST